MESVAKKLKVAADDACRLAEESVTKLDANPQSLAARHDMTVMTELGANAWGTEIKGTILKEVA